MYRSFLSTIVISGALFLFSTTLRSQSITPYLQAKFEFDSGSLADDSPNMLDGSGTDLSSAGGVEGDFNGAFLFNGTSSYIDAGTDNRNVSNQLTLSAWVKTTGTGRMIVASKYNVAEDRGYSISVESGLASMEGRDGSGNFYQILSTGFMVNDGNWHHIVGVIDGDTWRLFLDCRFVNGLNTGTEFPDFTTTVPLAIGRLSVANNLSNFRYFQGTIDQVQLYNYPLTEDQLVELSDFSCPDTAPDITTGLIAYYPLDGNGNDESGNELDGTVTGALNTADRFGQGGAALHFDGIDDHILVPNNDLLNPGTGPFSVSLWVQADDPTGGPQMLFQKGTSGTVDGPHPGLWLRLDDYGDGNHIQASLTDGVPPGTFVGSTNPLFVDQDWHHVVFQRTGSHVELWVDLQLVASLEDSRFRGLSGDGNLIIGAQNPWEPGGNFPFIHNHFEGSLDEVRYYGRALSPAEIRAVANTYCPEELIVDEAPNYLHYQAAAELSTSGTVTVGEQTVFQAGSRIVLNPGFSVQPGVSFIGKIEDCNEAQMPNTRLIPDALPFDQTASTNVTEHTLGLTAVPNPFRSDLQLSIRTDQLQPAHLQLLDMNGRSLEVIFTDRWLEAGEHRFSLDVSGLSPGMYFLNLRTPEQQLTKKIIKIR
ncbi:LamG-like jellyroll fold domain-containing protein [Flavilitoribacter nigricans]|nr:LamG-like jellyroll fold domain-containing protein [Flavilitoribacter nigricans]